MMVTFDRRPTECAVRWASSHSSVSILSGQMIARTSSSRISAAVPGRVREPGVLREHEVLAERHAEPAGAFGDLERGEPVHVDLRRDLLHRPRHVEVVLAVEVGVDAALETHLGGAALDRFDDPPLDLVAVEEIRVAAEVQRQRTLREGAELALERADVRVVDVAIAHERDRVAHGLAPQLIGDRARPRATSGPRALEQRDDLVDADFFAREHTVEHVADGRAGARRPPGGRQRDERRAASSPPAAQVSSRARPSRSDAHQTAKRTSACNQWSASRTYSGYTVRRGASILPAASVAVAQHDRVRATAARGSRGRA